MHKTEKLLLFHMSGERKILRYNEIVTTGTIVAGVFEYKLSCPFTPDEVKVRGLGFQSEHNPPDLFSLHVDGLGAGGTFGTPLGSFLNNSLAFTGVIVPPLFLERK